MLAANLFAFLLILMVTNVIFQPQKFESYGKRTHHYILAEDFMAKTQGNISDFGEKILKIFESNSFKDANNPNMFYYERGRFQNDTTYKNITNNITTAYENKKNLSAYNLTLDDDSNNYSSFDAKARDDGFKVTKPEDNPYSVLLVALNKDKRVGICTGTLLTAQWVLTAAHCIKSQDFDISSVEIYAGGNSLQELLENRFPDSYQYLKSFQYYPHPKYIYTSDYDIGVVKANGRFNMTKFVNTIKLSAQPWDYYSYYECKFTGFGVVQIGQNTDTDQVRKTHKLKVKNPCICSFMLKLLLGSKSTKRFICTKPEEDYGVCQGDSGGGLICDGEVRAVAMMILRLRDMATCDISMFSSPQCGSKTTLSVFQDSCPFVRWVNSHVQLFNEADISSECVDKAGAKKSSLDYVFVISFIVINIFLL